MSASTPDQTGLRAGPKAWLGLAVLALPTLVLALDVTVLFLALPHLGADLAPTSTQLLWITDIYAFLVAGFLITMGKLGDRIGRRLLLIIGGAAFGIASVITAYATSPEMLIGGRALLGIAGATLMPSTLALISNMFPDPKQRGMAIGVWTSCFSGGLALGPLIGGLMLQWFWWGSVFLLGAPVMLILVVLAPMLLPESRDESPGRIDWTSALMSMAGIIPVVYGIKETAKHGLAAAPAVAFAIGVVFCVLFVLRQRRLDDPLLDVRLFGNRSFTVALCVLLFSLVATGGIYLFVTQYLQSVEGLSPLQAGLWLLPAAGAQVVSSMLAPGLAQRFRPGYVVGVAQLLAAAGYLLLTQAPPTTGLFLVAAGIAVIYLGNGPMMALGTDLVVGAAPPAKAGSAASISETSTDLGVALGVAVLGSVGAAVYENRMADKVPAGVEPGAAGAIGDSLDKAVAEAARLPGELAAAVLTPAREAFTGAMHVVGGIGAALVGVLAVLTMVALRNVGGSGNEEAPETARAEPVAAAD